MKKRQFEYEDFPRVFKMEKSLEVVYRDHSEFYRLDSVFRDMGEDEHCKKVPFDPYKEIEMVRGNGGRRVHGMKTVKVIDFTKDKVV